MKQKKTLQILLLVFAGLIVLYTGMSFYQKQQSSKEDSDQTMISDLKSLTSISYNNNGTTLSFKNGVANGIIAKIKNIQSLSPLSKVLLLHFKKLKLSENLKMQML